MNGRSNKTLLSSEGKYENGLSGNTLEHLLEWVEMARVRCDKADIFAAFLDEEFRVVTAQSFDCVTAPGSV